jgi:4-amino-4-deoxy-L-arabinose transferase-like glycosyltransferase
VSRLRDFVPRAAVLCALVALANGVAWSLITPPFQAPDENAHYAYVQQLAERAAMPHAIYPEGLLSAREDAMLAALNTYGIIDHPAQPSLLTQVQQQLVEATARRDLDPRGDGDALTATDNPPLYYLLEAIPYGLVRSGNVLDQLAAMRALSALIGAGTVLLIYLFLMELLPGRRLAWAAGALIAAFQPLFGFMSGAVNNDDLLNLAAAGALWALARAFRRGLSPAGGALLGGFIGVGLVTKFNMIAFVPGAALAVVLLIRRAWSTERTRALCGGIWAVGLAGVPFGTYLLLNRFVWHRNAIPGGSIGAVRGTGARLFSYPQELSHIWQLFLPSLGMSRQFSYYPLWDTWFKGFFGRFGWVDFAFPGWVFYFALVVATSVCALAIVELIRRRRTLQRRWGELAVYTLVLVSLAVEIGVESYREAIISGGRFEQARYLIPMLGLYAAIAALAVRCGGRRWGSTIAAALVVLAFGHDLFAQGLTIARYYA